MFGNMGMAQWLYMAEAEGHDELVSTRTAKLNATIKDIKNHYAGRRIEQETVEDVARDHGLTDLSYDELVYISEKIR